MQVVRNAAVARLAELQPAAAARFWAGHPDVEISQALFEIGSAARARVNVSPSTFARLDEAAIRSPLSPEPFLVHGVQAQMAGDLKQAQQSFHQAQWRDPRSVPAAYFLAEYYLRQGEVFQGLKQTGLLIRLMPRTTETVAPYVAAYARNRATWPQIRALFRSEKGLQYAVLGALAQDSRNADAILALADAEHRKPDSNWVPVLLDSLVKDGNYAKARSVWASVSRRRPSDLLYDADFSAPDAPPPFNWALARSAIGLAERQPGKRLHVLFYGNADGALASQLLMLPAGSYHLQMNVVGSSAHPELLNWSLRCNNSKEPFATIEMGERRAPGGSFQVPANCPAQWIELNGRSGDVAEQADVTVTGLILRRAAPNA